MASKVNQQIVSRRDNFQTIAQALMPERHQLRVMLTQAGKFEFHSQTMRLYEIVYEDQLDELDVVQRYLFFINNEFFLDESMLASQEAITRFMGYYNHPLPQHRIGIQLREMQLKVQIGDKIVEKTIQPFFVVTNINHLSTIDIMDADENTMAGNPDEGFCYCSVWALVEARQGTDWIFDIHELVGDLIEHGHDPNTIVQLCEDCHMIELF